jgi:hypothetical protein
MYAPTPPVGVVLVGFTSYIPFPISKPVVPVSTAITFGQYPVSIPECFLGIFGETCETETAKPGV